MGMTSFEKAVIKELQGIRKELHELNKKQTEQGQVGGKLDPSTFALASYNAALERGY